MVNSDDNDTLVSFHIVYTLCGLTGAFQPNLYC